MKELISNQGKQIAYLKREIQELQNIKKATDDSKIELLRSFSQGNNNSFTRLNDSKSKKAVATKPAIRKNSPSNSQKSRSPTRSNSTKSPGRDLSNTLSTQKSSKNRQVSHSSLTETNKISFKESKATDDDLSESISNLERDLAQRNQKYKQLLQMSHEGTPDLSALRRDIGSLSSDIQQKSELLYDFKKRQQVYLREKLQS